ncbi:ankyrin repeat domain-containing protein [Stieleria sp. ICT_E10.1]|uniref:ankyrin repeat domain-containing protein n=1 Tax=Stieleria sedimenti TaxID=2976331 RepID=UPI0021803F71|nr:ankyrin repeat domain-containing protein [Stieleria sedimenti]MCS7469651.1 ankyrin repeat domain-containing protein [Stieleria sedimenti]
MLRAAIRSGNVELCHDVIENGATLEKDPAKDEALLRLVMVEHRSPELTDLLFDLGIEKAYPEQFDVSRGYSQFHEYGHPLYHAALVGDVDYCRYLMLNFPADRLWQPLRYSSYEYDSDIEFFNPGYTPLFAAVFNDHWEVLELFLTEGFKDAAGESLMDVNAVSVHGLTALHEAVNYSAARCVQLLLAFGADPLAPRVGQTNRLGDTPLHLAIHEKNAAHSSPSWPIEPERPRIFPMLATVGRRCFPCSIPIRRWRCRPSRIVLRPSFCLSALRLHHSAPYHSAVFRVTDFPVATSLQRASRAGIHSRYARVWGRGRLRSVRG